MSETTVATLPDVDADATLEDGRVRIDASDEATLYLRRPRTAPLADGQDAGRLVLAGDGIDVAVALSGSDVDALADALHALQDQLRAEVA